MTIRILEKYDIIAVIDGQNAKLNFESHER